MICARLIQGGELEQAVEYAEGSEPLTALLQLMAAVSLSAPRTVESNLGLAPSGPELQLPADWQLQLLTSVPGPLRPGRPHIWLTSFHPLLHPCPPLSSPELLALRKLVESLSQSTTAPLQIAIDSEW
jgi:hypothetical protein